jgi:hypothetical protein
MTSEGRVPARVHPAVDVGWRAAVGVGVGAAMTAAGLSLLVSTLVGGGVVVALIGAGTRPRSPRPPRMDPFTLSEPWRQFVMSVRRADQQLAKTVMGVDPGPLRDRLTSIAARLETGVVETWEIARRGDEIDDAVNQLDPAALRSRRSSALARGDEGAAEVESLDRQIESVERLKSQSVQTADTLRSMVARFDELAARATEVAVGAAETEAYSSQVDDLLVEIEGLRLAIEETRDQ